MRTPSIVALAFFGIVVPAHTQKPADRFTAFAVNLDSTTPLPTGAGEVEIVINRYSPEADATRIVDVLFEKLERAMLARATGLLHHHRQPLEIPQNVIQRQQVESENIDAARV